MTEEQLRKLNNRRNKIIQQEIYLGSKRQNVMSHLGLIDEKLDTLDTLKAVIDTQLNEEVLNGNLSLIVHNVVNNRDHFEPMVEIRFPGHPSIFKIFDELDYCLYRTSNENNTDNVVYINRLKNIALEWLKKQDTYIKYFDDLSNRNKRIDDDFAKDTEIDESINNQYLL